MTEIWSQMHKNPLKMHMEALKNQNFLGGDPLSFFLSLDSATPPREDYVQVDYALQSRY